MMKKKQYLASKEYDKEYTCWIDGDGMFRWHWDEQIIRCRDCKRMDEIQLETNQPCSTDPNGFCAWAERKDG